MTEAEWLAGNDPKRMLGTLRVSADPRRLRLFACACARRVLPLLTDPEGEQIVQTAERFADGLVSAEEFGRAGATALGVSDRAAERAGYTISEETFLADALVSLTGRDPSGASELVPRYVRDAHLAHERASTEASAQSGLVRDIFGNPFRPVTADPAWLTSTVVALAHGVYDERAFDRLPILADALQDAGCDHADLLDHCRDADLHARGCWVVDLLLGKA